VTDAFARPQILVAGIGNIFLGDDGFGCELATRLSAEPMPDGVTVTDYGIRGLHLAYDLRDSDYDLVVLLDALPRGDEPGTVYLFEPDLSFDRDEVDVDAHEMHPLAVLALLADLGGEVKRLLVVGCEPAELEERIGLSPVVADAVDKAVQVVGELLQQEISALVAGKES
jgi:hydrogenase maturation protease